MSWSSGRISAMEPILPTRSISCRSCTGVHLEKTISDVLYHSPCAIAINMIYFLPEPGGRPAPTLRGFGQAAPKGGRMRKQVNIHKAAVFSIVINAVQIAAVLAIAALVLFTDIEQGSAIFVEFALCVAAVLA